MDQKENRLNIFQQDAKNAIEAHCSSELSSKESSVLMQTLSEFSAFLCAENLSGLASATVERAVSFIKQQIHTVGTAAAELSRKAIEFFFQSRGDLQKNQELASIAEIKKSDPAPAKEKHFAKSLNQANKACALIRQAGISQSVGTQNTYRDCLKVFCDFIKENQLGDLKNVSRDVVNRFLAHKAATVGQKTCEKYKQAIQAYLHARGDLSKDQNLPPVHSDTPQKLGRRAYSPAQVEMIQAHLTRTLAFSTELSYRCGLRAHELLTIRRIDEKRPDRRFHKDGTEKSEFHRTSLKNWNSCAFRKPEESPIEESTIGSTTTSWAENASQTASEERASALWDGQPEHTDFVTHTLRKESGNFSSTANTTFQKKLSVRNSDISDPTSQTPIFVNSHVFY